MKMKKKREEDTESGRETQRETTEMRMKKTEPMVEIHQTFENKTLVAKPGVNFTEFIQKPKAKNAKSQGDTHNESFVVRNQSRGGVY